MAGAFVPDSVLSVVPKHLPGVMTTHFSRASTLPSVTSRAMFDPLFDLTSNDTNSLPMTEEEFYRMKIKLKDG